MGARNLAESSLGEGESSGWSNNEIRYTGADFEPWIGSIAFDTVASDGTLRKWFFDSTPNSFTDDSIASDYNDFLSVAVHEIGHVLGVSYSIAAFKNLVSGGSFQGLNAKMQNSGSPIPLDPLQSHIQDGFVISGMGENALDPTITAGTRKLPTALDIAILDDIGYSVNYPITESSFITIVAPNGGNNLIPGSSQTITWNDNIADNVNIYLYKGGTHLDGGTSLQTIASNVASNGSHSWLVPSNLTSASDYKIAIASTANSGIYDYSDISFTINPYLTVTTPNGGDTLQTGFSYNITWIDNIAEDIKIDLYKGGSFNRTIANSTASDGSYLWTVPSTLVGSDYQIRVTSVSNPILYDASNSNFTVKADLKKYWFHYNFNPSNYLQADSYSGSIVAPAGMYTVAALDGSYVDSDFFDPGTNFTETGLNGKYLVFGVEDVDDNWVGEAGKVFIHDYNDRDNGGEQHFLPYKYSIGQAAGTNYLGSEIDYIDSTQSGLVRFGQDFYEADPETTNWKAEFFNNLSLSGSPVHVEGFGGGLTFERQWGSGSPSVRIDDPSKSPRVFVDGFSTRVSSKQYLNAGLYQVRTSSDDGIRVRVGNLTVIDSWIDQGGTPPHSGYFYWVGGEAPITVEYYENSGGASLKFELMPAAPIQESVNSTTNWVTSVFSWDNTQSPVPSVNFYKNNDTRKIGTIDLGSNTRSDGKKGITFNFGAGALDNDPTRLPDDQFVVRSYTSAYFDGSAYKFTVSGDDGFQILAKNQATGNFYYITDQGITATPQSSWDSAYGGSVERTAALPQGQYDLHFHYFENGGNANFDLSWGKASNPDITIKLDFFGNFTQTQKALIDKAAQNWRNVITQDMVPGGVLNIAVTEGSTRTSGGAWDGVWAETGFPGTYAGGQKPSTPIRYNFAYPFYDNQVGTDYHTQMHFNSSQLASSTWVNTYLVRLATHEVGHALYLDEAQLDSSLSMEGIMDWQGLDPRMTEGIYQRLEYFGYSVNRNASVFWS